jgi:RNA polymerase sigma factor (sigma-70 family)
MQFVLNAGRRAIKGPPRNGRKLLTSTNEAAALPEDTLPAAEELESLQRSVAALPPRCKLALIMVRLDGASYEQVGECLGVEPHHARRLVERAMEYLLEAAGNGKSAKRAKRRSRQELSDSKEISAGGRSVA